MTQRCGICGKLAEVAWLGIEPHTGSIPGHLRLAFTCAAHRCWGIPGWRQIPFEDAEELRLLREVHDT